MRRKEVKRERVVLDGKEFLRIYFENEKYAGEYVRSVATCDENLNHIEHRRSDGSWFKKEYVQLNNGLWRVSKYYADSGYQRTHEYDLKTGRVISECDSSGNKNLVDTRIAEIRSDKQLKETPIDHLISVELENEMKPKNPPSPKVRSLF